MPEVPDLYHTCQIRFGVPTEILPNLSRKIWENLFDEVPSGHLARCVKDLSRSPEMRHGTSLQAQATVVCFTGGTRRKRGRFLRACWIREEPLGKLVGAGY